MARLIFVALLVAVLPAVFATNQLIQEYTKNDCSDATFSALILFPSTIELSTGTSTTSYSCNDTFIISTSCFNSTSFSSCTDTPQLLGCQPSPGPDSVFYIKHSCTDLDDASTLVASPAVNVKLYTSTTECSGPLFSVGSSVANKCIQQSTNTWTYSQATSTQGTDYICNTGTCDLASCNVTLQYTWGVCNSTYSFIATYSGGDASTTDAASTTTGAATTATSSAATTGPATSATGTTTGSAFAIVPSIALFVAAVASLFLL